MKSIAEPDLEMQMQSAFIQIGLRRMISTENLKMQNLISITMLHNFEIPFLENMSTTTHKHTYTHTHTHTQVQSC